MEKENLLSDLHSIAFKTVLVNYSGHFAHLFLMYLFFQAFFLALGWSLDAERLLASVTH